MIILVFVTFVQLFKIKCSCVSTIIAVRVTRNNVHDPKRMVEADQPSTFFYEADRKTRTTTKFCANYRDREKLPAFFSCFGKVISYGNCLGETRVICCFLDATTTESRHPSKKQPPSRTSSFWFVGLKYLDYMILLNCLIRSISQSLEGGYAKFFYIYTDHQVGAVTNYESCF